MAEIEELMVQMEPIVKKIASKLVKKYGYNDNYTLVLSSTMDGKYVGAIRAGQTPKILLNASTVLALMNDPKGVQLRYVLGQLLEKSERMQHSLSLSPVAKVIALPSEGKRFIKNPTKVFTIDVSKIAITYVAIAINVETGESIEISTASISNVEEAARIATERLAKIDNLMLDVTPAVVEEASKVDVNDIKFGNVFVESLSSESVKLHYDLDTND